MICDNNGTLARDRCWRYHNILHDDMRNGDGLRVTIFLSGCNHYCKNCQNPETWDSMSGIPYDHDAHMEVINQLNQDYISGVTLSGGDPLNGINVVATDVFVHEIRDLYPNKSIWIYTGYRWIDLINRPRCTGILKCIDVLVDGPFIEALADVKYHWAGSTNQKVIDVKKSMVFEPDDLIKTKVRFLEEPVLYDNIYIYS